MDEDEITPANQTNPADVRVMSSDGIERRPNGKSDYQLTREDCRKGGLAAARKARERKEHALNIQREWVETHGQELLNAHAQAIDRGDWRAAEAVLNRVLGMPTQRVERDERILVADLAKLDRAVLDRMIEDTEKRLGIDPTQT